MISVKSIDVSELGNLIDGLRHALIGTGQNGDLTEVVHDETRRLAVECSRLTPRAQKKVERSIHKDIGSVFMQMPANPLPPKKAKGDGVRWLEAGPKFLLGATDAQMLVGRGSDFITAGGGIKSILYRSRGRLPKEKTREVGMHGEQHVNLSNRFVIARSAMHNLFNSLKKRVGIRNASFAETADKLGDKSIPQKTSRHFPTEKNITQIHENAENPSITFGSKAKGIAGLSKTVEKAVKVRTNKIAHRINMILSGYAHDNNSGQKVRKHAHESK